jgi:polysaccharide chain length determinant protein (PEP-CTERM system associated)
MNNLLEQVLNEAKGVWRFRWIALAVAWGVCIIGWLFVLSLPERYRAQARIFVDTKTALTQTVQGIAFEDNMAAQLNYVRQSLLGAPVLERIARDADLDVRARTPEQRQALIANLRKQISIEATTSGRNTTDVLFTLSYRDSNREKSIEVVDRLLNLFIEDTLGGKRAGSEEAQRFLRDQIAEYEARLRAAEERLAAFKKKNVGFVPGEQGDYFARLQAEMDSVRTAREQLSIATSRRDELQRQLRGEQAFMPGSASASGLGGGGNDTTARILESRARLDELLLRFTERHPDVIALKETIAQLEQRQKEEIEALSRGDRMAAAASAAEINPVYQQLQLQLRQAEVDVATLQRQISDRENRIAELRKLLDTVPEVEAEFARLNRDYDVTRAQYTALVDRLDKARLSDQAQQTGAIRFEVIDPPAAPFDPVEPDRMRLIVMVLAAGLGLGGGLAYLLHQMKPVFNNVRTLSEITGLTVLGAVSRTWLAKHRAQQRRNILSFSAAAAALLIVFALTLALQQPGSQFIRQLLA